MTPLPLLDDDPRGMDGEGTARPAEVGGAPPLPERQPTKATEDPPWAVEEEALRALVRGDRERALTELMALYGETLHAYCRGMLGTDTEADDLLQVIFLQAFEGMARFEQKSSFKAWLFTIARHRALDEHRRKRRWWRVLRQPAALPNVSDPKQVTDRDLDTRELGQKLGDCLAKMTLGAREVLILRFQQEMGYDQLSAILGGTAASLRVKVSRAVVGLRRCLEQNGAWVR